MCFDRFMGLVKSRAPFTMKNMGTPDQQATIKMLAGMVSASRTKWQKTTRKIEITLIMSRYWILFCILFLLFLSLFSP